MRSLEAVVWPDRSDARISGIFDFCTISAKESGVETL